MKTYCINLDRRKDKWEYVQKELARVGITDYERFSAYDARPGWIGCRDSHIKIMELCKDEDHFMILEDDVKFLWTPPMIFLAEIELPYNWDFFSLGASPQEPLEYYSPHLFKLNKTAWCMHAYMITNQNGLVDFVLENRSQIGKIDKWFSENVYTNSRFNCFIACPLMVTQVQFQSDTCKRSDVSTIQKQYDRFVTNAR